MWSFNAGLVLQGKTVQARMQSHEPDDAHEASSIVLGASETSDGERAWTQAVAFTRDRSPASFDQWFSGVQFDGFTDGVLSLRARDEFVRQWIEDYFLPTVTEWLRAHTGLSVQVRWIIDVALERPVAERPSSFAPVRPRAISVRPQS